jgi:hypothetical protein
MANKLGRVRHTKTHLGLVFLDPARRKRGEIRLKPNRVLWAKVNEKGWRGVSLRKFEQFIRNEGKHQTK